MSLNLNNRFNNKSLNSYLEFAETAALDAGRLLMNYFGTIHHCDKKEGAGIVTKADKESEALIINYFKINTPDFSILAEESGLKEQFTNKTKSKFLWVIDPLDGTTNFFHGFPYFNVSIALTYGEEILLAVVYDPLADKMFTAIRGQGSFMNGKRFYISEETELENSLLGTGFAYMRGNDLKIAMDIFHEFSVKSRGIRRPGAAALDLAYTAYGVYDGFFEKALNPWDLAAGALLIKEAGGVLSDFDGKVFSIYNKSIVAANPKLHIKLIDTIKEIIKN